MILPKVVLLLSVLVVAAIIYSVLFLSIVNFDSMLCPNTGACRGRTRQTGTHQRGHQQSGAFPERIPREASPRAERSIAGECG